MKNIKIKRVVIRKQEIFVIKFPLFKGSAKHRLRTYLWAKKTQTIPAPFDKQLV